MSSIKSTIIAPLSEPTFIKYFRLRPIHRLLPKPYLRRVRPYCRLANREPRGFQRLFWQTDTELKVYCADDIHFKYYSVQARNLMPIVRRLF